jgi:p-hydroxybenzoate 3-monooxygenase
VKPPARTQVAIVGGGPAGLTLSHLLRELGLDAVVLEARSRDYVETRIRAGALEQGSVNLLRELGVAERLDREAMRHDSFELRVDGERHLIPITELAGAQMTVYGQQEVVKDLIALRMRQGEPLLFDAEVVELSGLTSDRPIVSYEQRGTRHELIADAVVAADGFHGIGRRAIPTEMLRVHQQDYPFAWLGILARVAPSADHVIYAHHRDGFGMLSMRSPELTRLYLQVSLGAQRFHWPDNRIWDHLHRRLATYDGWQLAEGPITECTVVPIRAFVAEPMRYGRLFLAGDAAHIVPPTGAKGLNLAMRDVKVLAPALVALLKQGDTRLADAYSDTCLRHVWWGQYFANLLARLVHVPHEIIDREVARAELRTFVTRQAGRQLLAENYTGIASSTETLTTA